MSRTKKTVDVLIIRSGSKDYWYSGQIGKTHECYRYPHGWMLKSDVDADGIVPYRHIDLDDGIELEVLK